MLLWNQPRFEIYRSVKVVQQDEIWENKKLRERSYQEARNLCFQFKFTAKETPTKSVFGIGFITIAARARAINDNPGNHVHYYARKNFK